MKLRKPDYYDEFRCIAGACSDSCCIGWEIDVDEEKRDFYRKVEGKLGERLQNCIDWEEGHFILEGKEERCPFLNQDSLCDLILELGEDALCDICREHPRFYDWFKEGTEVGLGLCCEAAGRLILGKQEPVKLIGSEPWDEEACLFQARDLAFSILQDRTRNIWERMEQVLALTEDLQEYLDFCDLDLWEAKPYDQEKREASDADSVQERAKAYAGMLRMCQRLEAIDENWETVLDELNAFVLDPKRLQWVEEAMLEAAKDRESEYEQLAVYVIYRYFMKCREDDDIRSKGKMMVFFVSLIRLMDAVLYEKKGEVTLEDRVQHAKCMSKEIEYSEENLELLADMFWERDEFSVKNMSLLLNSGHLKK